MVRQGSAKPSLPGSNPGAASIIIALLSLAGLLLAGLGASLMLGLPAASAQDPGSLRDPDIWAQGWVSDIPVVDLTGSWLFDPDSSDPMIESWRDREVRYKITQHPDHIDFEFAVEGGYSTKQSYRWDGTVTRFNRSGSEVQEIARWTDAGRVFEVRGRWWPDDTPDDVTTYELRYELRIFEFTFTQTNDSGSTVWKFVKERG